MALQILRSPFALLSQTRRKVRSLPSPKNPTNLRHSCAKSIRCVSTSTIKTDQDNHSITRRSANYPPSSWDYNFIQSLESEFTEGKYESQAKQLKDEVGNLIRSDMAPLAKLDLIDSVQRLGLKYQFETEIKEMLDFLYRGMQDVPLSNYDDHHATSLAFRIFRQHGFQVPAEIFTKFKEETGNFKVSLCDDVMGLLNMYEASFFGLEGETIIDEVRIFATTSLKEIVVNGDTISPGMAKKIGHALGMPLHWTPERVEARWYIETCQEDQNINPSLLELAKLDYNMVQSVHQQEVIRLAKWWVDTGLSKITFARDRLVEHYFWCCGIICGPQYGEFREIATKVMSMVTTIDDVYDVYGTLDELELVTDFVDRWDMNGIDKLPHNIQTCVLAMYNNMNVIGNWFLEERGINIIPSLSKSWGDLCKAYLVEAKWYHGGYKPTLEEYLSNAVVSISGPLMLFCAYFMTADNLTEEQCHYLSHKLPGVIYCSSMILRLNDDLGTSSVELARGDNPKAVECYMYEAGVSEEVAREYIEDLVREKWKAMNKELMTVAVDDYFREPFVSANPNLARTSHCFYQFGDGHGFPSMSTKDHLTNSLLKPFPLNHE